MFEKQADSVYALNAKKSKPPHESQVATIDCFISKIDDDKYTARD